MISPFFLFSNNIKKIFKYLYDNTNAIIYIINTNTKSNYYGGLIDGNMNNDYINDNIDLLYEAILNKDDIEQFRE